MCLRAGSASDPTSEALFVHGNASSPLGKASIGRNSLAGARGSDKLSLVICTSRPRENRLS